jgi:hypothetical protein
MAKNTKPSPIPNFLKLTWKDAGAEAHGSLGILAVVVIVLFSGAIFAIT